MSDQASTIMVNTLEPQSGTTLTVGKSGQNLQVNADSLKANVAKDAGGNAVFTSDGSGNLSGLNSAFGSAQTLIQSQSFTDQATVSFTTGIDSTYKEYYFEFITLNPATDGAEFAFQGSTDSGSNYNVTITSSYFRAHHSEADTESGLAYEGTGDQAQGTAFQYLGENIGNDADSCLVGTLSLFNLASTTYVKNFYATMQMHLQDNQTYESCPAGYFNTTSAINAIQFKMLSGNFDGTIKLYGIS